MNNSNLSRVLGLTDIAKIVCALLCLAVLLSSPVLADTHVWVGNSDKNLATATNWSGGAPANHDAWEFGAAGSSGYNLTNNIGTADTQNYNSGIVFTEDAKTSYTIGGNWTRQQGNIVNKSSYQQNLNLGHELHANIAINAANGDFYIGGTNSINTMSYALTVTGAKNTTIDLIISGKGSIIKDGTGTLTLKKGSIFSGGVTVKNGTLILSNNTAAGGGKITLGTGADDVQLTLQQGYKGANITNAIEVSATGTGNVTLLGNSQFASQTGALTINRTTTLAIPNTGSGTDWWYGFTNVSGSGDVIIQGGDGGSNRIMLSGSSYMGDVYVENGVVQIGSSIGMGDIILGTSNTGTRQAGLRLGFGPSNDIIVAGGNATIDSYVKTPVLTGNLTLNSNVTLYGASDRLTWESPSKWSGSGNITIAGNRVTSSADATAWTGNITINSGSTFQPAKSVALSKNNSVTNNGTFQICDESVTINGLSGNGTVKIIAAPSSVTTLSLTIGAGDATSTFSGTITDGAKVLSIVKAGTGTLTLSGANTYTGGTTVSAGTLQLSNNTAAGNSSKTITLGDANTSSNDVQLKLSAEKIKNPITVSNQGSGKAILTANYRYGSVNTVTINRDTIINSEGATANDWWFSFGDLQGTGTVTIQGPTSTYPADKYKRVSFGGSNFKGAVVLESGNAQLGGVGTATVTIGNKNTTAGTTADLIVCNCNPANIIVSSEAKGNLVLSAFYANYDPHKVLSVTTNLQLDNNLTINGAYDRLTWTGGTWSGDGNITIGYSRVTSGADATNWTGNMIINSGTIFQPAGPKALSKNNSITNNGTLWMATTDVTINGLSGSGNIQNIVDINSTLTIGAGDADSTYSGTIQNGQDSKGNDYGTLGITKAGAGTLTLSGNNAYTGITTIEAGVLKLTGEGTLGSGVVDNKATLEFAHDS